MDDTKPKDETLLPNPAEPSPTTMIVPPHQMEVLERVASEPAPIPTAEIPPVVASEEKPVGKRGKKAKAASGEKSAPSNGGKKRSAGGRASHAKGSNFERSVGRSLSLWLTHGERNNLFNRNVMSGGQWTSAVSRGKTGKELNLPGDLAAAHPQAFEFLKHFTVEVKHNNMLVLGGYLLDTKDTSFIGKVVAKVADQATKAELHWIFIGKQDRRPTFVLVNREVGQKMTLAGPKICYHWLFRGTVCMFRFVDMVEEVDPDKLLSLLVPPVRRVSPAMQRRVVSPALIKSPLPRRPLTAR